MGKCTKDKRLQNYGTRTFKFCKPKSIFFLLKMIYIRSIYFSKFGQFHCLKRGITQGMDAYRECVKPHLSCIIKQSAIQSQTKKYARTSLIDYTIFFASTFSLMAPNHRAQAKQTLLKKQSSLIYTTSRCQHGKLNLFSLYSHQ